MKHSAAVAILQLALALSSAAGTNAQEANTRAADEKDSDEADPKVPTSVVYRLTFGLDL